MGKMKKKPIFIALEGQDGVGKATQSRLLDKWLAGEGFDDILNISLPQYGQWSAYFVEEYLAGKFGVPTEVDPYRASVFYALDRYDANEKVKWWLANGGIVLADRWTMSNVVHQGAKIGGVFPHDDTRAAFLDWLIHFEHIVLGILKPFYIFFEMPPEVSIDLKERQKKEQGRILDDHEKNRLYQQAVASLYYRLAVTYHCGATAIVRCCDPVSRELRDPMEIHQDARKIVSKWLAGDA